MPHKGVFETLRSYDGRLFAQGSHVARLRSGCRTLGIKPPDEDLLELALRSIIREKHLKNARLRLAVLKTKDGTQVVVSAQKLRNLKKSRKGFSLFLEKGQRMNASVFTAVKSLDRGFYERIFKKAKRRGYDEAVFLNTSGEVAEGTRTNVFLVKNAKAVTPALAGGCLPGITRGVVVRLLGRAKIPCAQRRLAPEELFEADEIFLTNSVVGVMPVTRLDKKLVGAGRPGVLTQKVMALYKKEVEKECYLR